VLAVKQGPAHFEPLADLCVAGGVKIHIDHVFALNGVPAALARVGEGRALGKVVVGVASHGRGGSSMAPGHPSLTGYAPPAMRPFHPL